MKSGNFLHLQNKGNSNWSAEVPNSILFKTIKFFLHNKNRQIRDLPSENKTLNSITKRLILISKAIRSHSSEYIWEEGKKGDS